MLTKNKVLIIKLGHSETLDPEISKECSLGDVVRTTVLLNYFRDSDNVTWLCDEQAEPLLRGNPYINRVLTWDFETAILLQQEYFDVVINLEKSPGVCAMVEGMKGYQKLGFRLSLWHGGAEAYVHTEKVLEICYDTVARNKNQQYWQEHLAKVVDKKWRLKDTYVLSERKVDKKFDVGLNWMVGNKWPEKDWGEHSWALLSNELSAWGLNVSRQIKMELDEYTNWIASCRSLVTCDSLGMHLAIAYGIPVIGLFGPTSSTGVYFYDRGVAVQSKTGKMQDISVQEVMEKLSEVGIVKTG